MRACYPVTWLDEICACFSASQAKHVRRRLEDGEELRNVFVVCKIFKNFLRRAFVDYSEGDPEMRLDPMEKELFAFQLQDVESSRHMAFHGEGVSVEETILSLSSVPYALINHSYGNFQLWLHDRISSNETNTQMDHNLIGLNLTLLTPKLTP